jgi:hypothetical protein
LESIFASSSSSEPKPLEPFRQDSSSSWTGGGSAQTSGGSYYGGDGSGSFMDGFHRFVYETDQWNPIALAWDGVQAKFTGTDRYNNELSGFESSMKIVSAVPMTKVAGVLGNVGNKVVTNMARRVAVREAEAIAVKGGQSFFQSAKYSQKVLKQMSKADDLYHGFPKSVDGFAAKFGEWSTKVGADGKTYQWLEMHGSYGGKTGTFEFIKDAYDIINHRYFKIP